MRWQFTIFFVVCICPIIWAGRRGERGERYHHTKVRNQARTFLSGSTIRDLGIVVTNAANGHMPIVAK